MRRHVRGRGDLKNSSDVSTPALRCTSADLGSEHDVFEVLLDGSAFFRRLCRVSLVIDLMIRLDRRYAAST